MIRQSIKLRLFNSIMLFVFSIMMIACGNPITKVRNAARRSEVSNDLKLLGLAYHMFNDSEQKPPMSFSDLEPHMDGVPASKYQGVTIFWGAPVYDKDSKFGTSEQVLAYAPVIDGVIPTLFLDGSVKMLPPAELEAAPKAKPKQKQDLPSDNN